MKKILATAIVIICCALSVNAQTAPAKVSKVVEAEDSFNKLVARKGIKEGFLAVADPDGIVFRPKAIRITDFYKNIAQQDGSLSWQPKFARISAAGDLAFSAGPYVYQNGKPGDDKVYGDYVSIWHADSEGKLKLLIDLGIQHPEIEEAVPVDFKDPDPTKKVSISKDPFNGKAIILNTDKLLNDALSRPEKLAALAAYKEFLSPEGRYYFPGFEPMTGSDKILRFLNNEGISISAETVNAGRSASNDLAYSHGRARIKKGSIVSNFSYVRIWEIDAATHKWNILLEVFAAEENE